MSAEHSTPPSGPGDSGAPDLWARTRAAGDHPHPWDQPSEPVAVTVVQPCTCGGSPRPRSRLAATARALLGWAPTYVFDPACPAHQQLGDLPAYRRSHPPIVFAEREPRTDAWRHAALAPQLPPAACLVGPPPPPQRPGPDRPGLVPAGVVHALLVRRAAGRARLVPAPPVAAPLAGLACPTTAAAPAAEEASDA